MDWLLLSPAGPEFEKFLLECARRVKPVRRAGVPNTRRAANTLGECSLAERTEAGKVHFQKQQ